MSEVTLLLRAIEEGDPQAANELLPLVYDELRRLAASKMSKESPGHTLQPTALVHEAWIRLSKEDHDWVNRRHFFSAAAESMRRILLDRARAKGRIRRGGHLSRVDLEDIDLAAESESETVLFVNEALEKLALDDPTTAELVKLRFFAGIPNHKAAEILGLSDRTARRNWAYARAYLTRELNLSAE